MPIVNTLRSPACLVASVLLVIACGPPQASDTGESSTTASSDTSGEDPGSETGPDPGTETGDDPTTSTTASFVPEDDHVLEPCDSFEQDCPEGEKCVPYSTDGYTWDSTKCVSILGSQGPGEPCVYGGIINATDDCGADSWCWDVQEIDGELIGECVLFCTGSSQAPICPEGSFCTSSGSGVISVCVWTCDPLLQDCEAGEGCYWTLNEFTCVPEAEPGIEPGEPCAFINDCVPGSYCVSTRALPACADAACCTPYCSLTIGDPACAVVPGTSCVPFFEPGLSPPGYEQLGVCLVEP